MITHDTCTRLRLLLICVVVIQKLAGAISILRIPFSFFARFQVSFKVHRCLWFANLCPVSLDQNAFGRNPLFQDISVFFALSLRHSVFSIEEKSAFSVTLSSSLPSGKVSSISYFACSL